MDRNTVKDFFSEALIFGLTANWRDVSLVLQNLVATCNKSIFSFIVLAAIFVLHRRFDLTRKKKKMN